jgi:eukaryotic-like serine/threonine-protein kinase
MASDPGADASTESGPRSLGRYELGPSLGASAYGALRKAKVTSGSDAGRQVVVRVLDRADLSAGEIELLSAIGFSAMEVRDPHLTAVLDVVLEERWIGVVSEWVDGVRLRDVLARAREGFDCPPPVAIRIAKDVLLALKAAIRHWSDIYTTDEEERPMRVAIHGGLLPDTVLVATFGETMLCEIGMSGAAMSVDSLRDSVEAISHRAPEQLAGTVDERSDVFTIGVLLWELLAGRTLFGPTAVPRAGGSIPPPSLGSGSPLASVKRKLVEGGSIQRLDMLPKLKGHVSKSLADLVARATDREAKRRFTSLDELLKALDASGAEIAEHEAVASHVSAVIGPASGGAETPSVPPFSNRPTRPPIDTLSELSLQERATKPPSLPGVTEDEAVLAASALFRVDVSAPPDLVAELGGEPSSEPAEQSSRPASAGHEGIRGVRASDAASVTSAEPRSEVAKGSKTVLAVLAAAGVAIFGLVLMLRAGDQEPEQPPAASALQGAPRPAEAPVAPVGRPPPEPARAPGPAPDAGTKAPKAPELEAEPLPPEPEPEGKRVQPAPPPSRPAPPVRGDRERSTAKPKVFRPDDI